MLPGVPVFSLVLAVFEHRVLVLVSLTFYVFCTECPQGVDIGRGLLISAVVVTLL